MWSSPEFNERKYITAQRNKNGYTLRIKGEMYTYEHGASELTLTSLSTVSIFLCHENVQINPFLVLF